MRRVSLYIPCYNAQEYIAKCLEGVLKQTYPIDEILVIDDGPTDETAEIATHYPVTLIQRRERLGLPSARNLAFRQARNDFVAALDADCVPEPEWLERLMEDFTEDDIAGIGGRLIEKHTDTSADKWREVHMKQHWGNGKIINPNFLFGCNGVFRKQAVLKIGLFDEVRGRMSYEDVDISQRLKNAGYKLIYEPQALVHHLRRDTISSVLKTYWRWVFPTMPGLNSVKNVLSRLKTNLARSKNFFIQDLKKRYFTLLTIDLLLFLFHSYYDLRAYLKK